MKQEEIGKVIKKIRTDNGYTQKEFADLFNVTFQSVSKWENGLSIPDIAILKSISEKFDVDLNSILDGKDKPTKKRKSIKKIVIIIFTILVIISLIIGIELYIHKNDDINLKPISTTCENFKIEGSVAYNDKKKIYIYISNINYCGDEQKVKYQKIDCILYEDYKGKITKVSSLESKENISLNDYFSNTTINVNNYFTMCKDFENSNFYLEVSAQEEKNKIIKYNIPITLKDNC